MDGDSSVITASSADDVHQSSAPEAGSKKSLKRGVHAVREISQKSQLTAIFWGITYSLRALLLTVAVTVLVMAPVILSDGGQVTGKSFAQTTLWSWLVLNGVAPKLGAAVFTLVPWGLVLIPWLVLLGSGRSLGRRIVLARAGGSLTVAALTGGVLLVVIYTAFGTLAAMSTTSVEVSFDPIRALVVMLLVSLSAVAVGIIAALPENPFHMLPNLVREMVIRGFAALLTLAGIAALLVAVQLVGNFAEVLKLANGLNPGLSGFLAILLLSLGYLPVLVVWAMSYMLGAGFVIGPEAVISPFIPSTAPTQLPPLPILAALPSNSSGVSWLLPAIVVAVGALVGIGIARRKVAEPVLIRMVIALGAALVAALCVFLLVVISSGNLGDVRLVGIGPDATLAATLAWILLILGAAPVSALPRRLFEQKRPTVRVVSQPLPDQTPEQSDAAWAVDELERPEDNEKL